MFQRQGVTKELNRNLILYSKAYERNLHTTLRFSLWLKWAVFNSVFGFWFQSFSWFDCDRSFRFQFSPPSPKLQISPLISGENTSLLFCKGFEIRSLILVPFGMVFSPKWGGGGFCCIWSWNGLFGLGWKGWVLKIGSWFSSFGLAIPRFDRRMVHSLGLRFYEGRRGQGYFNCGTCVADCKSYDTGSRFQTWNSGGRIIQKKKKTRINQRFSPLRFRFSGRFQHSGRPPGFLQKNIHGQSGGPNRPFGHAPLKTLYLHDYW